MVWCKFPSCTGWETVFLPHCGLCNFPSGFVVQGRLLFPQISWLCLLIHFGATVGCYGIVFTIIGPRTIQGFFFPVKSWIALEGKSGSERLRGRERTDFLLLAWLNYVPLWCCYPWLCVSLLVPYSLGNHARLRGGRVAERLRSMLAYGWVEHCSNIAGYGTIL